MNLTHLPNQAPTGITSPDSYHDHRSNTTPLVIDNGSTTLRFGFATSTTPHAGLNAVAKYKERKFNKPLLLFGEGIDAESGAKGQTRTPWEGDVLLNFDALVCRLRFARPTDRVTNSENLTMRRRKMPLTTHL
jgi:actin-related protein 5